MRLTLVLLLGAFALRLFNLTFQPLWFDEGWSVWFATSDLPTMAARTAADIHPPFYYAALHVWIELAGVNEFSLRLFSVFVGVLLVAATYRLARDVCNRTTGWLAALLAAAAPLFVFYAQEIRMYGLVTLLGIASSWLFWKGVHGHKRRYWVAYVVITSAAIYTQYYGAFIPLFHLLFWIWILLTDKPSRITHHASRIIVPLISFFLLFLLYLPWLLYVASQLTNYVANKINEEQYASLSPLDYFARHLIAFAVGHLPNDLAWFGWITSVFVGLLIVGLAPRVSRTTSPASQWFLLLYLLTPLLAGYLIQLRFPFAPPRMERLLLLAAPPFLILVANGLAIMDCRLKNLNSKIKNQKFYTVLAVLLITSVASLASFYTVPRYPEQAYRPLAQRINALALPSDVVFLVHPWQVGFLQAYLDVPVRLQMVASPAWGDADQAQIDAALKEGRRVWLPAYQTLGRILETEMEKYLSQNALPVEAKWYETTRLSFYAPAPKLTSISSFTILNSHGSVFSEGHAYDAGWDIIPLRVLLFTPATQGTPPAMSIRLKDGAGRVWAATDRRFELQDDGSSYSSPLFADALGFLIPAGTPPGLYELKATLYDAATQQPLGPETTIWSGNIFMPDTPPPIAALPIQTELRADWPSVRLLGYTLPAGHWRTGDVLHADLFWQAQETSTTDERTLIVVQDASGRIVSQTEPSEPPPSFARDQLLHTQHDVLIPAGLSAGSYRLSVMRQRATDNSRVRLTNGADQVALRDIVVTPRPHQFNAPSAQQPQDFRFADVARIVGSDFARDDQSLRVRIYWQALRELSTSYRVFVHIAALADPRPIAQHDGVPADGEQPTTSWVSGEYIADEHRIALPADLRAGTYRVLVGLYDPRSGARVPAIAADGRAYENHAVELARIEMK